MRAKIFLSLASVLIGCGLAGHTGRGNQSTAPPTRPTGIQEQLKTAWIQSRQAAIQKSQEAFISEWLAPLDSVVVVPQMGARDLDSYRLTDTFVKTTVARRLERSGVKVYDDFTTALSGPDAPPPFEVATLIVEVLGMVQRGGNVAAVCIIIKLEQDVAMVAADTPTFARVPTWQRAAFLMAAPRDLHRACWRNLEALADQFSKDWSTAHGDPPTP